MNTFKKLYFIHAKIITSMHYHHHKASQKLSKFTVPNENKIASNKHKQNLQEQTQTNF